MLKQSVPNAPSRSGALRLQLLILVIATIVTTTMIPQALRHPAWRFLDYTHTFDDVSGNILLYMPLGLFLRGSSLWKKVLIGFLLSLSAETLQLFYVHRTPSPVDLATNTLGTLFGGLLQILWARLFGRVPEHLVLSRKIGWLGIPIAIGCALILVRRGTISDFSNWDPSFEFALGNEVVGNRPWAGEIMDAAVYASALSAQDIRQLAQIPSGKAGSAIGTVVSGVPVFHLKNPVQLSGGILRPLSPMQDHAFYNALVHRNKMTLLVWFKTNDVRQDGPARIITYSRDTFSRNFTLGQVRDQLTFRLRTPASGYNGTEPALYTGKVLVPDQPSFVAVVYDGRISSLYLDGEPMSRLDLGAQRPQLPRRVEGRLGPFIKLEDLELIASEVLISGTFVIGIFAMFGSDRSRKGLFWIALLSGAFLGGWIWSVRISSLHLGMRIMLECIGGALVVWASLVPSKYNDLHERGTRTADRE